MKSQEALCQVDLIHPLTDTVVQILMTPLKVRFNYLAGQYVEIITENGDHMPFSIANAPLGGHQLELHIRHTRENAYSHNLLAEIKRTGKLFIKGPFGHCTYQRLSSRTTLLLAAGTGFAPIKAIIEQALMQEDTSPMYLYWNARNASDLYLDEVPQHWAKSIHNFGYTPVLPKSCDNEHWQGQTGLVYEIIAAEHPNLSNYQVYAAGPPQLIQLAWQKFQTLGLKKEFIYSDCL